MFEQCFLLGARDGLLLVASDQSNFLERFAVRLGSSLIPFGVYDLPLVPLLRGQDILAHAARRVGEPWRLLGDAPDASLTRFMNREWAVDGQQPWLLSTESEQPEVIVTLNDPAYGVDVPVLPGVAYELSARLAMHQAQGELRLRLFDQASTCVSEKSSRITNAYRGGTELRSYQDAVVRLRAPEEAATARIEVILNRHELEPTAVVQHSLALLLNCSLRPFPDSSRAWAPTPTALPLLMRAIRGEGRAEVYAAPIELGVGTGVTRAEVVALDDADQTVATWDAGVGGAHASIKRLIGNGVQVEVSGTTEPLSLYIDGQRAGGTRAVGRRAPTRRSAHVVVSDPWCDGGAHVVEVRDFSGCHLLDRSELVLPGVLTPWKALQKYAPPPLPFHLAPAASYRYSSLRRRISALEQRVADGEAELEDLRLMAQVSHIHRVLEKGFERNQDFAPLQFPIVDNPTVSVVVPVHNKFSVTYHCLCALLLAPNDVDFEVVVVDDGSSDKTLRLAEICQGITVVRNEDALGFVGACNNGAAAAKGDFVVLLNNDTEPTAGWLDELLAGFGRFNDVGMTGARLLWPNGRVQDAGGIVWNSGNPWNYGRDRSPDDPRFSYARQADYLSGAALMIARSVWDKVGGLSEEFAPAYFEDTDLAFKVREVGYTTWFIPSANVFHYEGISNGRDVKSATGLKRFQEVNRPKFVLKWAGAYANNGAEGQEPDLAKDRGIVGRVLFIDRAVPKPDRDAGSFAAIQEMRLVQSLGYKVTFLPLDVAYMGRYSDDLGRLGVEAMHSPFAVSATKFLEERGGEFDAVYVTRYNVAERVLPAIREHAPQAKLLFCNADLHFLRELRAATVSRDPNHMAKALEIREAELSVMRRTDVVLSYNKVEHAVILSHGIGDTEVVTAPWVVETVSHDVPRFSDRQGIAFLGGYLHPPNLEAVDFFARHVMPELRERMPDICFNIYGADMPERFRELADEAINPIGYVSSVDEVYDQNRVFVAPLLSGAGIKGKVLGALAHGIPSVLSSIAAEGTGVRDGVDCMVVGSVRGWIDAISSLYEDEALWTRMSRNAREFTTRHYSFASGRELMRHAFEVAGVRTVCGR